MVATAGATSATDCRTSEWNGLHHGEDLFVLGFVQAGATLVSLIFLRFGPVIPGSLLPFRLLCPALREPDTLGWEPD